MNLKRGRVDKTPWSADVSDFQMKRLGNIFRTVHKDLYIFKVKKNPMKLFAR